jgi:hypothetical protein
MLSEIRQTQKDKYHVFWNMCSLYFFKKLTRVETELLGRGANARREGGKRVMAWECI